MERKKEELLKFKSPLARQRFMATIKKCEWEKIVQKLNKFSYCPMESDSYNRRGGREKKQNLMNKPKK